jgi:hypothetical protein
MGISQPQSDEMNDFIVSNFQYSGKAAPLYP